MTTSERATHRLEPESAGLWPGSAGKDGVRSVRPIRGIPGRHTGSTRVYHKQRAVVGKRTRGAWFSSTPTSRPCPRRYLASDELLALLTDRADYLKRPRATSAPVIPVVNLVPHPALCRPPSTTRRRGPYRVTPTTSRVPRSSRTASRPPQRLHRWSNLPPSRALSPPSKPRPSLRRPRGRSAPIARVSPVEQCVSYFLCAVASAALRDIGLSSLLRPHLPSLNLLFASARSAQAQVRSRSARAHSESRLQTGPLTSATLPGDPDAPSDPPCRRCRRESRDCVFTARANARSYVEPPADGQTYSTLPPHRSRPAQAGSASSVSPAGGDAAHAAAALAYAPPSHSSPWGVGPSTSQQPYPVGAAPVGPAAPPSGPTPPGASSYHSMYGATSAPTAGGYDPSRPHLRHLSSSGAASSARADPPSHPHPSHPAASLGSDDEEHRPNDDDEDMAPPTPIGHDSHGARGSGPQDANVLLSSTLHNPSDALRLLATASSLRALSADTLSAAADARSTGAAGGEGSAGAGARGGGTRERAASGASLGPGAGGRDAGEGKGKGKGKGKEKEVDGGGASPDRPVEAGWERWVPVKEGMVTVAEAEALLAL